MALKTTTKRLAPHCIAYGGESLQNHARSRTISPELRLIAGAALMGNDRATQTPPPRQTVGSQYYQKGR